MQRKVGDKVRIRSREWYNEQANSNKGKVESKDGVYFNPDMREYCDRIGTITRVESDGYRIDIDGGRWKWSEDFLEDSLYKLGDTVIIKSKDWWDSQDKDDDGDVINPKGRVCFSEDMSRHCGKTAKIIGLQRDGCYKLDVDRGYYLWDDWMIEGLSSEDKETAPPKFKIGDTATVRSKEWFDEHEEETIRAGLYVDDYRHCGESGKVVAIDTVDMTYRLQFANGENDTWWTEEVLEEPPVDITPYAIKGLVEKYAEEIDKKIIEDIKPSLGDFIYVSDKYHEDGPREDWTLAKFKNARARGISTEHGIWNYCIPLKAFTYTDWEATKEHIYRGENHELIKVNKDE